MKETAPEHTRNTEALAVLARRQNGVFCTDQARKLGYTRHHIATRVARGEWVQVNRGVYALSGCRLDLRSRLTAACLGLPGAVASHESAAWLHGFPHLSRRVPAVVCVGPKGASTSRLVRVHRYDGLDPEDVWTVDTIPVTSPALTIFHLSAVLDRGLIERIVDERLASRSVDIADLLALLEFWTRRGRPRRMVMRRVLEARGDSYVPPESELEFAFTTLLRDGDFPEPVRQSPLPWDAAADGRVDFSFPAHGLVVEVDGRRWHTRARDFERDRARDRSAQLMGLVVLRYSWHEVTRRPNAVRAELRQAFGRSQT